CLSAVRARLSAGDFGRTVRESTAQGEALTLLPGGSVLFVENQPEPVPTGQIPAGANIRLQVGDNVTTAAGTFVLAILSIDIHGDYSVVAGPANGFYESGGTEPTFGTVITLRGTIGADFLWSGTPAHDARIFGNQDADTILFDHTTLTSRV